MSTAPTIALWTALAASLAAGCIADRVVTVDARAPADSLGSTRTSESYIQGQSKLDVLFVIDNTTGMPAVQDALIAGIGGFIDRLELARAQWRIGVISSDLGISPFSGPGCMSLGGDGAALQNLARIPGCTPPTARYITRTNVADPRAAFACIARLGDAGCGFEQPLAAALKAIDPQRMPAVNQGFLRDDALLMVVVVSNEDDCSAAQSALYDPDDLSYGPWTSYRCFAHGITCQGGVGPGGLTGCASGGPQLLGVNAAAKQLRALAPAGTPVLVALVGPSAPVKVTGSGVATTVGPSCSSAKVQATPAIRIGELVDAFGADGVRVSVCSAGLGYGLAQATGRLRTSTGPYCLRHALEDPGSPACAVSVQTAAKTWLVPPGGPGEAGFHLVHPLVPGCEHGALDFDAAARPPAGARVTVTCDFASSP